MAKRKALKSYALTPELARKARLLELAGDPTRLRILCFMFERKEACVSTIAQALGESIANISRHLQIMRDNGYFETERRGTTICYRLIRNDFTRQLRKIVCSP